MSNLATPIVLHSALNAALEKSFLLVVLSHHTSEPGQQLERQVAMPSATDDSQQLTTVND